MKAEKVVVFDLDDTLMYEIDFLKSAYKEIAIQFKSNDTGALWNEMMGWYSIGKNVFDELVNRNPSFSKAVLLDIYRNHFPSMNLNNGALEVLKFCKEKGYILGLISDGLSITQRNKLEATGIVSYFDKIIISEEFGREKPCADNYKVFYQFDSVSYFYIADNPKKDFISPKKLGWDTICLKNRGLNIHEQNFNLPDEYLPKRCITDLIELIDVLM